MIIEQTVRITLSISEEWDDISRMLEKGYKETWEDDKVTFEKTEVNEIKRKKK